MSWCGYIHSVGKLGLLNALCVSAIACGGEENLAADAAEATGLVFSEDYESGSLDRWNKHGGCFGYSFVVQNDPTGAENNVLRVKNVIGDDNRRCATSEWFHGPQHRAELIPRNDATATVHDGETQWWAERFLIPEWPGGVRMILLQEISAPWDGTDLSIAVTNGSLFEVAIRQSIANGDAPNRAHVRTFPLITGRWVPLEVELKRSTTNGSVKVWLDRELVVNYQGPTSQSRQPRSMMKHGLYHGNPNDLAGDAGKEFVIYYDDVHVGHGPRETGQN